MPPHYERLPNQIDFAGNSPKNPSALGNAPDDSVIEDAARALRQAHVDAAIPDVCQLTSADLERMNIDELRLVAKALDVPDRAQITDQEELIAAIRRCTN